MDKRDRVRVEHINRIAQFVGNSEVSFGPLPAKAKTKAQDLVSELNDGKEGLVVQLEGFETGRETGAVGYHGGATSKASLRHGIILDLIFWNETAAAIASVEGKPAIMDGFRVPHGASDEKFAAKVRAIVKAADPLTDEFIALGFATDFLDQMTQRVDAFEAAKADKTGGLVEQKGAFGGLSATIREGIVVGRQLNVIFKNLYKGDAERLAAWETAYRIERVGVSGKKKQPAPPPTP
jgi:hypothetical protein